MIVWSCIFVIIFVAFIIIGIAQFLPKSLHDFTFGAGNENPGLNVINVTFGGSLHKLPTRNFARSILLIFIIYCFIMQNSYKGGLFKFMQKTLFEPEVASTNEMLDRNFHFHMLKSSRAFLTDMPKVMEKTIFETSENYARTYDKVIHPDFKGAVLSSEDHLAYRNILAAPDRYYRHAPEIIITYNIVIYMHKQSCLTRQLNEMIIYLVSGGLIDTWASKFIDKQFLKYKSTSKAKALNMQQLMGAFQLLMVGLAMSFVTFCFEHLFVKMNKRKSFCRR